MQLDHGITQKLTTQTEVRMTRIRQTESRKQAIERQRPGLRGLLAGLAISTLLTISVYGCAAPFIFDNDDDIDIEIDVDQTQQNAIAFNAIAFNGFTFTSGGPYGLEFNGVGSVGGDLAGASLAAFGLDGLYVNVLGQNGVSGDGQGVNAVGPSGAGTTGIVKNGVVLSSTGESTVGESSQGDSTGLAGYAINGVYTTGSVPDALVFNSAPFDGNGITGAGLDGLAVGGHGDKSVKIVARAEDGGLQAVDLDAEQEDIFLDVLYHLVACSLATGDSIAVTASNGAAMTFHGIRGLAAEWKTGALDGDNQAAVRACLESSPVATSGVALNAEQAARFDTLYKYMVQCALPEDEQAVLYAGDGTSETYQGQMGLAPEWRDGPVSAQGKRRVSACLAARANALGQEVQVSLRGSGLATAASERDLYDVHEGAFWADLFADEPYVKSCAVEGGGLSGRVCADGEECGFTHMGDCTSVCGSQDPGDGHFLACEGEPAVVSTFLSLGSRMRASGDNTTCMLEADGSVWCWGINGKGQVGDGTTVDRWFRPTRIPALGTDVVELSVGTRHACARKRNGSLWCWGGNQSGQLGIGQDSALHTDPVHVDGLGFDVTMVHTGRNHTCAVKSNGTAWCWGNHEHGQVGNDSDQTVYWSPVEVTALGGIARLSTAIDSNHTCAINGGGDLWCWGFNEDGQLGDGTTTTSRVPVAVAVDDQGAAFKNVTDVCSSEQATWARKTDGTVWTWGQGITRPQQRPVGGFVAARGLSCGTEHVCVVTAESTVWCMGKNDHGQLGYNTQGQESTLFKQVEGVHPASFVTSGADYSCATLADSTVWCWGDNAVGLFPDPLTLAVQRINWTMCGDGTCEADEDRQSCALDC